MDPKNETSIANDVSQKKPYHGLKAEKIDWISGFSDPVSGYPEEACQPTEELEKAFVGKHKSQED